MAEIEKITDCIIQNAKSDAQKISENAQQEYDKVMAKAKADAQKASSEIIAKAKLEAEQIESMAASSAAQKRLRNILDLKNKAINETINNAKNLIYNMSNDDYMRFIIKNIKKYATGEAGVIAMNGKDKRRLSEDAEAVISENALTLDSADAPIEGGFVLKYGQIEINCSVDAVFQDKNEQFTDYISRNLFK